MSFVIDKVHALSLSVSPPNIELVASSPDNISVPIQITNENKEQIALEIEFMPFSIVEEEIEFLNIELPIKHLVAVLDNDVPTNKLNLLPGQSKNLTLALVIPPNEEPRDYYFSIAFISSKLAIPQEKENEIRAKSFIRGGVAINVLLSIASSAREAQSLGRRIKTELFGPSFVQEGPVELTFKVKNEGIHFTGVSGSVIVTGMGGLTTSKIDIPPQTVLAGMTRDFPLTFNGSDFLLGPYQATLKIYNIEAKHSFFILPFKKIFGMIIITVISFITIKRVRARVSKYR